MVLSAAAFYVFAAILLAAGVMVVSARNPVHSVLYLIVAFFNAAVLFLLIGAEFIAMILIIVYVGAVAVLFLFVVMMLDISFQEIRRTYRQYVPLGALIGTILMAELALVTVSWAVAPDAAASLAAPTPADTAVNNTEALGQVLYTHYVFAFQVSGLILLVAMIGAIVLTLRSRGGLRRQVIAQQIRRRPEEVLSVRKVPTRGGV
ncbi:NADH-quinone oxidoreductase subunit J [Rhodospirillum centenum]|uniref:NADH-quinone oxidoreductase subunit J n=1 Tax=Rhodospirillum centenum (strain ATCC 51521 / SW) TaxID=414684 RepID=B6ISX2_RHOCS|nr:NADH-quinone oxidoreductase subunit J [Rhodospirillum centenum]ACI98643.1 NADH-quinone oxidoreductase chain J [Rhodospirillum centenum SW]